MKEQKECGKHGVTEFRRYKSGTGGHSWHCIQCQNERKIKTRAEKKLKMVEYMGGKCEHCGEFFEGRPEVFDFHHINPEEKTTRKAVLTSWSWDKIVVELEKCIMLCSNCHRTEHARVFQLAEKSGLDPVQ